MDQQRRCLTGMVNGVPIAVPQDQTFVTVHTFDTPANGDPNGRPALDVVSLYVNNRDSGSAVRVLVQLAEADDTPISGAVVEVPAAGVVQVFDETPFSGLANGATSGMKVRARSSADGNDAVIWGWFVRTGG